MSKSIAVIDHIGKKGGNHYYSLMLLKAFHAQGFDTFIYSNFTDNSFPSHFTEVYPFSLQRNAAGMLALLGGTLKAARLAKRAGVKHIIFHLFEAGWINHVVLKIIRMHGLKVIGIAHDISSFVGEDSQSVRERIYRKQLDHIIVHNQFSYEMLKASLPAEVLPKTHVIPHGGHTDVVEAMSRETALQAFELDDSLTYLLFFGQIKKVKGLDLLLEAFSATPDHVRLIIAGKPWKDDFSTYQELIDQHKIGHRVVKLIRYISDDERNTLYQAADLLVLPYREIFQSGVLLMGMSYGLPVLASNLPANAEVVQSGSNGMLFESGNSADLSAKLVALCDDAAQRKELGKNAKSTISGNFNWSNIVLKYVPLLE